MYDTKKGAHKYDMQVVQLENLQGEVPSFRHYKRGIGICLHILQDEKGNMQQEIGALPRRKREKA